MIRAEIRASELGVVELAERYNVSRATVAKWKSRDDSQDRSCRPHELSTTLSEGQEISVAEIRRLTLIPLDDLLVAVREFINPVVSRSALDRCLRRHGVGNLRELQAAAREAYGEATAKPVKSFKDYEPGFVHVDIKYLSQMSDESSRRYLFVAIDRAARWVFLAPLPLDASDTDCLICGNPFAKRHNIDVVKRRRRTEPQLAGAVALDGTQLLLLGVLVQVGVSDESNFLGSVH
jgi:hypothetical protein